MLTIFLAVRAFWSRLPVVVRYGAIGLLVLVGAFLAGRYTRSPVVVTRVETKTVVQTVEHQVVVQAKAQVITRYRVVTVTPTPAGPVRRIETSTHVDTDTHATTTTQATVAASTSVVSTQSLAATGPKWRVGALGGVLIQPGQPVGWLVGGQVEHQIAGPFYGGVWAVGTPGGSVHAGAVGISLGGTF